MDVPAGSTVVVTVDRDLCMSSGRCVANVPMVFAFDDENVARVRDDAATLTFDDAADASAGCPAGAIGVEVDGVPVDV